ncbi:MAG TPA: hypothetical protein VG456_06435 [Candidatus Sulfopaludibacter sp.]|jgi:hypothetical protein|nr:hypothetical protein [Candidatus Sulfopaludibacter sp.]
MNNGCTRWAPIAALFLAGVTLPLHAQTSYHYTGNPFTFFSCGSSGTGTIDCPNDPAPGNSLTSYTATDHVTATLTFTSALAPNLNYQDVSSLPGFQLTMNDGHQTLTTPAAGLIAKVSTDSAGNIIGPWLLVINVGNAADSGISSENEPPVQPFIQDQGTLACCDPILQGDIGLNQNAAGTWQGNSQPTPSQMASALLVTLQQMSIPKQGTSLSDQVTKVVNDINAQNGLACSDSLIFAAHVKAQTGKTVTATQSNQLLTAIGALEAALHCGS